ncbi:uncharacterized protein LOC114264227 [Camellia sinensis]|uniref:uncharacterized protein LOC114264227 n=1 Tax=Camellia sinensis TaxID=4442 RepID=UPI0010356886|nr:uncharacterized protein LOC114264227 [Camellia sinensis]
MTSSTSYLFTDFSSSAFSSSSDDESDDAKIVSLVGLYEINKASMIQMLTGSDQPKKKVYSSSTFWRRFRMRRDLYLRILHAIEAYDTYFVQKKDATHILGLSPLQKMTSAIRMLAYGVAVDTVDDYVQIGERTTIKSLKHFCNSIIEIFGPEYLRSPSPTDSARLLAIGEVCRFLGHQKKPTIILEAVILMTCGFDMHFFGIPRSHNDLNVLDCSPLFSYFSQGKAPPTNFTVNRHTYNMGYYLADDIYPPWATLVQTISSSQ